MTDKSWVTVSVAVVGAIATIAAAWIGAAYKVDKVDQKANALAQTSVGSLTDGQKLCSAVVPYVFRDSLIVPHTWKSENCRLFSEQVGGSEFQLGCVFDDGVVWGAANGGLSSRNCGW